MACVLLLAGCGSREAGSRPLDLAGVAPGERAACAKVAEAVPPARCPAKLPGPLTEALDVEGTGDFADGCGWLRGLAYENLRAPVFHVLVGASCRALPLDDLRSPAGASELLRLVGKEGERPGGAPGSDPPPIHPEARGATVVRGQRAVVLRFGGYERAGTIHGGHDAVIWNEDGAGWVVSLHFQPRVPDDTRLATLRAVAASMRPPA